MFRFATSALVLLSFMLPAAAQTPPATGTSSAPAKSQARKQVPKPASDFKPIESAASVQCEIGLLSTVVSRFGVQQVGFTMFGNEYTAVAVDGWGLDDLILSRIRAAAPGKSVKRIAHQPNLWTRAAESGSPMLSRNPERQEFVQQSAASSKCRRYVLVERHRNSFSNTNQSVEGFGIVKWGNPIKRRTFLFALTYVTVYDGQSFDVIKKAAAGLNEEPIASRVLGLNPISGPNRELDEAAFPSAPADAATDPKLRDGVRTLLTTSLDRTLPQLLRQ